MEFERKRNRILLGIIKVVFCYQNEEMNEESLYIYNGKSNLHYKKSHTLTKWKLTVNIKI